MWHLKRLKTFFSLANASAHLLQMNPSAGRAEHRPTAPPARGGSSCARMCRLTEGAESEDSEADRNPIRPTPWPFYSQSATGLGKSADWQETQRLSGCALAPSSATFLRPHPTPSCERVQSCSFSRSAESLRRKPRSKRRVCVFGFRKLSAKELATCGEETRRELRNSPTTASPAPRKARTWCPRQQHPIAFSPG